MVDLDQTKNVLANQRHTIPGDPEAATYPPEDFADSHSVSSMSGVVIGAGYTLEQVRAMTKNDLIMAFRQVTGNADH